MLKLFIVMVPMIVGAALAGAVRAETMIAVPAEAPSAIVAPPAAPVATPTFGRADVAPPAHLPEPATWAIMMTGIGVVGAVSRRRRARALAAAA